jgi:hypothetical protein
MNQYEQNLLAAIEEIVTERIKQYANFNTTITATINDTSQAPKYILNYNGTNITALAVNNATYNINDVVYVLILNNNFSEKIILCKKP